MENQNIRSMNISFGHCNQSPAMLRWAIQYLCEALKNQGARADIANFGSTSGRKRCEEADVVLFYRTLDKEALEFIKQLRAKGKFIIYFIDDYIFQPHCKYAPGYDVIIPPFFAVADAVVSSNSHLLSKVPVDKPKILRRSVIDKETFDLLCPGKFERQPSDVRTIGWLAGVGRKERNKFVKEMLQSVSEMLFPHEKVRFVCFGNHGLGRHKGVKVVENQYVPADRWQELYKLYRDIRFDVVVNPLDETDEFFHSKSELKYVETGAMMVPIVTSRVHPFTEVIKEGVNGFLASTPREFAEKALMTCRNAELAEKVALVANENVRLMYDSIANARKFALEVIREVESKRNATVDIHRHKKSLLQRVVVSRPVVNLKNISSFDGNVVGPVKFYQFVEAEVVMSRCVLTGLSVFGATYCRNVRMGAKYHVSLNGKCVVAGQMQPSLMLDNSWWPVKLGRLETKDGDVLTVRITNMDSIASLGFYECRDKTVGRLRFGVKGANALAMKLEVET